MATYTIHPALSRNQLLQAVTNLEIKKWKDAHKVELKNNPAFNDGMPDIASITAAYKDSTNPEDIINKFAGGEPVLGTQGASLFMSKLTDNSAKAIGSLLIAYDDEAHKINDSKFEARDKVAVNTVLEIDDGTTKRKLEGKEVAGYFRYQAKRTNAQPPLTLVSVDEWATHTEEQDGKQVTVRIGLTQHAQEVKVGAITVLNETPEGFVRTVGAGDPTKTIKGGSYVGIVGTNMGGDRDLIDGYVESGLDPNYPSKDDDIVFVMQQMKKGPNGQPIADELKFGFATSVDRFRNIQASTYDPKQHQIFESNQGAYASMTFKQYKDLLRFNEQEYGKDPTKAVTLEAAMAAVPGMKIVQPTPTADQLRAANEKYINDFAGVHTKHESWASGKDADGKDKKDKTKTAIEAFTKKLDQLILSPEPNGPAMPVKQDDKSLKNWLRENLKKEYRQELPNSEVDAALAYFKDHLAVRQSQNAYLDAAAVAGVKNADAVNINKNIMEAIQGGAPIDGIKAGATLELNNALPKDGKTAAKPVTGPADPQKVKDAALTYVKAMQAEWAAEDVTRTVPDTDRRNVYFVSAARLLIEKQYESDKKFDATKVPRDAVKLQEWIEKNDELKAKFGALNESQKANAVKFVDALLASRLAADKFRAEGGTEIQETNLYERVHHIERGKGDPETIVNEEFPKKTTRYGKAPSETTAPTPFQPTEDQKNAVKAYANSMANIFKAQGELLKADDTAYADGTNKDNGKVEVFTGIVDGIVNPQSGACPPELVKVKDQKAFEDWLTTNATTQKSLKDAYDALKAEAHPQAWLMVKAQIDAIQPRNDLANAFPAGQQEAGKRIVGRLNYGLTNNGDNLASANDTEKDQIVTKLVDKAWVDPTITPELQKATQQYAADYIKMVQQHREWSSQDSDQATKIRTYKAEIQKLVTDPQATALPAVNDETALNAWLTDKVKDKYEGVSDKAAAKEFLKNQLTLRESQKSVLDKAQASHLDKEDALNVVSEVRIEIRAAQDITKITPEAVTKTAFQTVLQVSGESGAGGQQQPSVGQTKDSDTYTVKGGDSLSSIAKNQTELLKIVKIKLGTYVEGEDLTAKTPENLTAWIALGTIIGRKNAANSERADSTTRIKFDADVKGVDGASYGVSNVDRIYPDMKLVLPNEEEIKAAMGEMEKNRTKFVNSADGLLKDKFITKAEWIAEMKDQDVGDLVPNIKITKGKLEVDQTHR